MRNSLAAVFGLFLLCVCEWIYYLATRKLTLAISNKISLDKIYTSWFVLSPIECLLQTSNGQHSNKCLLLRYNYTCLYLCRRVLPWLFMEAKGMVGGLKRMKYHQTGWPAAGVQRVGLCGCWWCVAPCVARWIRIQISDLRSQISESIDLIACSCSELV